jgi:hypothetical protein
VVLGRPKVAGGVEAAIREKLAEGHGMVRIAKTLGVGVSTVQRVKKEVEQIAALNHPVRQWLAELRNCATSRAATEALGGAPAG